MNTTTKYILCILCFLISISYVSAAYDLRSPYYGYDGKPIYTIENCVNATLNVESLKGNYLGYKFKDCSKVNNTWFCDCKFASQYNLTLMSETSKVNDYNWSKYRLYIEYTTYETSKFKDRIIVNDYGSYVETDSANPKSVGFNCSAMCGETVRYVNNTVYVNQTVIKEVPIEIVRYVNVTIEHNNTIYVQDYKKYWFEFWR